MPVKVQIIFYSTYGHVYRLAEAIAEGMREVPDTEVQVLQVAETLSNEILGKMGALDAKKPFAHVPIANPKDLASADALRRGRGPDACVSRRHRLALERRRPDRQGWQRVHFHRHAARRSGDDPA